MRVHDDLLRQYGVGPRQMRVVVTAYKDHEPVEFQWCGACLQGVGAAKWIHGSTYHFLPCGHTASFYDTRR